MRINEWLLYDKSSHYADRSMKQNIRTYFPKRYCEAMVLVDWETLRRISQEEYVSYYSIKPTCRILADDNTGGLFAVGFVEGKYLPRALRKYKKIVAFNTKDEKVLDKVTHLV